MAAVLLFTLPIGVFTGCVAVQEGSDPFVVNAERFQQAAVDTVDSFLLFERENRGALLALNPEIKKAADDLRVQFPPALQSSKDVLRAYKANRTEANRASVETVLSVLEQLRREAVKWFNATQPR